MRNLILFAGFVLATIAAPVRGDDASSRKKPEPDVTFLDQHCYSCHEGAKAEAGLDLTLLSFDLDDPNAERRWVQIFDRMKAGEMPPPDAEKIEPATAGAFLQTTGDWIRAFQQAQDAKLGRVRARRLTRREVERSLQDLLGIDIPLANELSEDPITAGFTTVADGQSISHFQLERHLAAVDKALDEAFRRTFLPPEEYVREFNAEKVARSNPKKRCREPEIINGQAVTWSSTLTFYGRLPVTTAPVDGWYRFQMQVSALKLPEHGGVWSTIRTGPGVASAPILDWVASFEATAEPRVIEFECWIPEGHMLEVRPGDSTIKRAKFEGGQVGVGEGDVQEVPGIAIDWITMEQFHKHSDDEVRRRIVGDIEMRAGKSGHRLAPASPAKREDAAKLVKRFAERAFRYPVSKTDLEGYLTLMRQTFDDTKSLEHSLRIAYRAILCSPRFLYLTETPGKLNDYALAARLSYFLTGSTPDDELTRLAESNKLHEPQVLKAQTDRLLSGSGARRFVEDFADEWLDLRLINFTEPDGKLFPEFDAIVERSMLDETRTFLETMLRDDLNIKRLVTSDFTYLNSRLARFYDVEGVEGDALQRVKLKPENHRGGLLTQGAVLKVTANGSNTSPVVRGVWISERILGETIPPPPANIPAIEPDIRGATTIREQLAKHRSQDSCASCHSKIDPPGFALESYDPAGARRDRYVQRINGKVVKGSQVDPGYVMPDGQGFTDLEGFCELIASDPRRLAHCVAEKLATYGTGAPILFADREAVDRIVDAAATKDNKYGFRSLVYAVVRSPLFLNK